MTTTKKTTIQQITLGAILTALVILLQIMGQFIRFGPFSVSLVLIPIVIGAAMCGPYIGAWLGFVFGVAVLLSGDAAAFLVVSVGGTILTVLLKGTLCGLMAGLTYRLVAKRNVYVGVFAAALVCPLVNTGVFLLGCVLFFMDTVAQWAVGFGFGSNVAAYMFLGLAGGNFLFELAANLLLSPVVVKLLRVAQKLK
ncbi:MAG: ECF transporter S component [Ruminococcaceae bacterium]|nr:ECF transporter S component [Oscillospiraceae bacterium]